MLVLNVSFYFALDFSQQSVVRKNAIVHASGSVGKIVRQHVKKLAVAPDETVKVVMLGNNSQRRYSQHV